MDFGIQNKTVLVTASSKGIGRAIADGFVAEGCNVIMCSRNEKNLINAAEEISSKYNSYIAWKVCDINNPEEINAVINFSYEMFGGVDILVNNCGGPQAGFFQNFSDEDWQYSFEQVLLSAIRFTRLVLPNMQTNKWGRIINITSVSVKQPVENLILSTTFRLGLTGMSKTLSNEYAKYGITINNVAPGYTYTDRIKELSEIRAKHENDSIENVLQKLSNEIPMQRIGTPDEVASAVIFLASQQAGYITGNTITVDGGRIKNTL